MSSRAVLITGGNLGDVDKTLARAAEEISKRVGEVVLCSSIHYSQAWGFTAAERFGNQVLVVNTDLGAEQLLEEIWQIEALLGRNRDSEKLLRAEGERYSSRTIDIDIIFYDDLVVDSERLTIPHPLFAEREFVLRPLAEVLPDYRDPRSKRIVRELLTEISRKK